MFDCEKMFSFPIRFNIPFIRAFKFWWGKRQAVGINGHSFSSKLKCQHCGRGLEALFKNFSMCMCSSYLLSSELQSLNPPYCQGKKIPNPSSNADGQLRSRDLGVRLTPMLAPCLFFITENKLVLRKLYVG